MYVCAYAMHEQGISAMRARSTRASALSASEHGQPSKYTEKKIHI